MLGARVEMISFQFYPVDVGQALEHLALAWAHLLELCSGARLCRLQLLFQLLLKCPSSDDGCGPAACFWQSSRPVLHDLVKSLYDTFLQLAPLVGKPSQGLLG